MKEYNKLYKELEDYAKIRQLPNTSKALVLAKERLEEIPHVIFSAEEHSDINTLEHCMNGTKMLIDLHIMLDAYEEDLLLASMLCHDMLKLFEDLRDGRKMVETFKLDPNVYEIVRLVTRPEVLSEENRANHYKAIQNNKLAVLVELAIHSDLVEQLAEWPISHVRELVGETRNYLLPMCVYAKEYYHDCQAAVHIMMEKIVCLIDVTEIIANRYQKREMAYTNEILSLMEENARLRGMIRQFENNNHHL